MRASSARTRGRGLATHGRFVADRRLRATDVTRIQRGGAGFGRCSAPRSTFVTHPLRRLGRRPRSRVGACARAASHARAARTSAVAGQHDTPRAATARSVGGRRALLNARCALSRSRDVASDSRHTRRLCPCYHRPSPVVSSVPVTGRTVTMPDARARSRISSSLQLWAGLRRSTPRLRNRKR
jgi:hypothetical protein